MPAHKVLFISHDASRTGATLLLLNLLKHFSKDDRIQFQVLLKKSGELESDFRALAPVKILHRYPMPANRWQSLANRLHYNKLKKGFFREDTGLIYSNTITNGEVLGVLSPTKCPVITHVHELNYWIRQMGEENLERVKKYTDQYIAVSETVKQNLISNCNIPGNKIDVVHGFIPLLKPKSPFAGDRSFRKSHDIPEDACIVGSSGMETWRKGKDLFIQLALNVTRRCSDRDIHFVWIGGSQAGSEFHQMKHDICRSGLSDQIHLIKHVTNPIDYYREFDIFAMISREDPFPLVNLEVAALGKPIVCFDNAGGTPEFVEHDAGFVVPYLDIHSMADKVIMLAKNENLRKELGSRGAQKVARDYDISVGTDKIFRVIERIVAEQSGTKTMPGGVK